MGTPILTVKDLKCAIRRAHTVWILPRFGLYEGWVKITKREAMHLANSIPDDFPPDRMEMYSETFGEMRYRNQLYMGPHVEYSIWDDL